MLPVDWPTDARPAVVPVTANGGEGVTQVGDAKQQQAKEKDGEVTSAQQAE